MSDPKPTIVHPFGRIGGAYEVDAAGLAKHRLACAVAVAVIGLSIFRELLGTPLWLFLLVGVAGFLITLALCADVARNGRKI